MKFRYIAIAAACAALTGQANALTAAQTQNAQLKLYVSGSSALQAVINGILSQNCGGDLTNFKGLAGSAAGSGDSSNGASHNVSSCTLTGNDFGASNVGKTVAVIKRDAGGSAQGVYPVAFNSAIAFIDLTTCNDSDNTCNGVANQLPDAGVSDLEPVAFNDPANQPTAFSGQVVAKGNFKSSVAVADQIFALIVNDNLYNQLVSDQGTSTPSITSSAFASIYSSGYSISGLNWTPVTKSAQSTNQVNICSRAIGSGTRATAQILFNQLPNNKFATFFAAPSESTAGAVRGGNTAGALFISEESSSGNVVSCVGAANNSGGFAVGIVGADRNLAGTGTHFVNLDNQVPGRPTAKEGQYPWVFESFYNVNKLAPNLAFATAFGTAFAKPSNIAAVPAPANNGVMAVPKNCSGTSYATWTGDEANFCSRVTRGGDSRLPLTFAK